MCLITCTAIAAHTFGCQIEFVDENTVTTKCTFTAAFLHTTAPCTTLRPTLNSPHRLLQPTPFLAVFSLTLSGDFDFEEFLAAFASVIDDNGHYKPPMSVTAAQLHALTQEYHHLEKEKVKLVQELDMMKDDVEHKLHRSMEDVLDKDRMAKLAEEEASRLAGELSVAEKEIKNQKRNNEALEVL